MAPAIQICRASRDGSSDAPEAGVGVGLEVEHLRMSRGGVWNQTRSTGRGSARRVAGDCARRRRDDAGTCQQRLFKRDELAFPRTRRRSGEARTWTETSERVPSMDSRMRRTPPGVTQDAIVCCLRSSGVAGAGEVRCARALAPFSKLHLQAREEIDERIPPWRRVPARAGVFTGRERRIPRVANLEIENAQKYQTADSYLKFLHLVLPTAGGVGHHPSRCCWSPTLARPSRLIARLTRPRIPCRRTPRPRTGWVRPSPPPRPVCTPPSSAP